MLRYLCDWLRRPCGAVILIYHTPILIQYQHALQQPRHVLVYLCVGVQEEEGGEGACE